MNEIDIGDTIYYVKKSDGPYAINLKRDVVKTITSVKTGNGTIVKYTFSNCQEVSKENYEISTSKIVVKDNLIKAYTEIIKGLVV